MTLTRPALSLACLIFALGVLPAAGAPHTAKVHAPAPKPRTMQEILDASSASDWRHLDPGNTLYLDLAEGHRVVIELAPRYAPAHVANIRTLAHEHYWDGLTVNRSQDNFVVQWGDAEEDAAKRKSIGTAKAKLPAEFEMRTKAALPGWSRLKDSDGWAPQVGFVDGFPAARDPRHGTSWITHCYGVIGAGRDAAPDSSNGTELYIVTGQSPRQLDRNITVVGRVVQGMEWLSTIPRGTGALGFFEKPEQRVPMRAIRLAADVPVAERENLEVLRTDTPLFDELVEARRNRRDDWYKAPAGHIDICNVPLPVRTAK